MASSSPLSAESASRPRVCRMVCFGCLPARYLGFVPAGDGMVFIVLELCDARTLQELVRGDSFLTAEFRRSICRQIACGLAYVTHALCF
jgi:serine/threonine protein kinase